MLPDFSKLNGLLPAIVQDAETGHVLMLAFMNEDAFRATLAGGFATFYSRSRKQLWVKGESSGHRLLVRSLALDCDADALLLKVNPQGPGVCHEGFASCFSREWKAGEWLVTEPRTFDPVTVYERAK